MNNDFDELFRYDGCASCGYKADTHQGKMDVSRVIDRLDATLNSGDIEEAERLLCHWQREALYLQDKRAELSIVNEQIGLYRRMGDKEKGLTAVERALSLIAALDMEETVSAATVLLNAATTLKAFGKAEEAEPLYHKTLAVYEASLAKDDPLFGGFYNNYGLCLADLNRKEEAEKAFFSALAIMEGKKKGLLEAGVTYVNLAHLYELWKDEQIHPCLMKAKALLLSSSIPRDGFYAFNVDKCIPSFLYYGLTEEAELLKRERNSCK
ncbi:MAG: tetratricopeptide repeat protein [Clostridia bacterium]|nr:tetratricopeptide repeat protein [Clostridia bacterium]